MTQQFPQLDLEFAQIRFRRTIIRIAHVETELPVLVDQPTAFLPVRERDIAADHRAGHDQLVQRKADRRMNSLLFPTLSSTLIIGIDILIFLLVNMVINLRMKPAS